MRLRWLLRAFIALLQLNVWAYQVSTSSPSLIKTTTQLVQLTVVATGRRDAPVSDLTRDQFQIFEGGTPRAISTFTKNGDANEMVSPAVLDSQTYFSNFSPRSSGAVNVLLLDEMNTDWKSWELAWPQVLRFIRSLRPGDHLAIYSLDAVYGLRPVQDYTSDTSQLLNKLRNLRSPSLSMLLPSGQAGEIFRPPSFVPRNNRLDRPELLSLGRVQGITVALQVIADHLAGVGGRKSLIWLAGNFPNPFQSVSNATFEAYRFKMLRAVNHLISADVAIYPVDARALLTDPSFDVANGDTGIHPLQAEEGPALVMPTDISALLELASRSGGKAYVNTNGLAQCMENAASAGQGSYTLGFYTTREPDDKYHSIRIVVKRRGIRLRYRPGYWDFSKTTGEANLAQDRLRVALESPFTTQMIELQARPTLRSLSDGDLRVALFVNSNNLSFRKEQGAWNATLDVIFGQKDVEGKVFAIPPYRVPVRISEAALASHAWLKTETKLALRQQSRTVRIVVRDEGSGNLGSLDIPFKNIDRRH